MTKKNSVEPLSSKETKLLIAISKDTKSASINTDSIVTLMCKSDTYRPYTHFLTPLRKKDGTMKNPKSTSTPELWASAKDAIAIGCGKAAYAAWKMPNNTKGRTKYQIFLKSDTTQRVGSILGQVASRLKREQEPKNNGSKSRQEIFSKRIADNIKLINELQEGQWNKCPADELKSLLSQIKSLLANK